LFACIIFNTETDIYMKNISISGKLFFPVLLLLCFKASFSQNIGINSTGSAPDPSAGLDVSFSNKGLLIPRLGLSGATDVSTISSPATSLLIYNTATAGTAPNNVSPGYYYFNGSAWVRLGSFISSGNNIYFNTGNVGIGSSSPANLLTLNGTNPLALHGLQTSPTTSDSLLTLSGGVVKRLAAGALTVSSSNAWSLIGNTPTTGQFFGTTGNQGVNIRTNGAQRMYIDSVGSVAVGTSATFTASPNREKFLVDAGTTNSFNVISGKGSINSYLQLNIQNRSAGTNASSDVVASNDAATESINFVNMGINSSGNTSTNILGGASTAYLYSTGNDFLIGNGSAGKDLKFFTNGLAASDEKLRITSTGQVGIGSSSFTVGDDAEKVLIDAGTTYNTGINAVGNIDDFYQVIVQNKNDGNNASSDFVVASDQGSQYVDFGINSSGYSENKSNILNQIYTAYLYASCPQWFYIGHGVSGKGLVFFTNSGSTNAHNSADGFPRMQITSAGNVGIGNFVGSGADANNYLVAEKLMVDGNITPKSNGNGNLGTATYRWNTVFATNGTISTSDRRLKTNIHPLQYGLKQILSLEPVSFKWKTSPTGETKLGLIAQDVKKVLPEAVIGDESKENLGLNYSDIIPVLINAVKEQQKMIEKQQAEIKELKKLVNSEIAIK